MPQNVRNSITKALGDEFKFNISSYSCLHFAIRFYTAVYFHHGKTSTPANVYSKTRYIMLSHFLLSSWPFFNTTWRNNKKLSKCWKTDCIRNERQQIHLALSLFCLEISILQFGDHIKVKDTAKQAKVDCKLIHRPQSHNPSLLYSYFPQPLTDYRLWHWPIENTSHPGVQRRHATLELTKKLWQTPLMKTL